MILHLLELINNKRIVLASEDFDKSTFASAAEYVRATAVAKAEQVFKDTSPDLVVSADTIVVLDNNILEKPSTPDHAKAMLHSLSGRSHVVYTAVCLILKNDQGVVQKESFVESTAVFFADLSDQLIEAYVNTGTPMDKAGGYGIQEEIGSSFITKIDGCFWNVTGFPLQAFCSNLLKLIDGNWILHSTNK